MMVAVSLTCIFLSIMSLAWTMLPDVSKRAIRRRVLSELAQENRPTVLSQLADILAPVNRLLPTTVYFVHVRRRLDEGGVRMTPMHFLVLQEMAILGAVFLDMVVLQPGHLNIGWVAIFAGLGFVLPYVWLNNQVAARKFSVSKDLPEVVDLLSLCVDAGVDLMSSLSRIVKDFRRCPTTEELGIVIQEVRIGKRRRDALRAFSVRINTSASSSFARTLIQTDRMGTGIAEALRILSEDMRLQRYHWAERFAQQAPLKMLIPLLFSLASALIIVAGPILLQFLQGGFSGAQYNLNQKDTPAQAQ